MKIKKTLDGSDYSLRLCAIALIILFVSLTAQAQSTNQSFPTAITTNEISGKIPARDIGDSRLTSYFYTFNATQGDVFINVVMTNFNGDIDVFTADNLRPLTKITIYADTTNNETGRVIYLRQPTKLILRIEGRTPNDDAATFRIKFAGSFAPAELTGENPEPETPKVTSDNQTDIRVNSVGTIIEVKPKPTPTPKPKETVAQLKTKPKTEKPVEEKTVAPDKDTTVVSIEKTDVAETKIEEKETEKKEADTIVTIADESKVAEEKKEAEKENKSVVVITDEIVETEKSDETKITIEKKDSTEKTQPVEETSEVKKESVEKTSEKKKTTPVKPLPPAALENIRLVILFKDGSKIERQMSDVLKVGVDKGILTVIAKDGSIGRYSILDVEKMTIE